MSRPHSSLARRICDRPFARRRALGVAGFVIFLFSGSAALAGLRIAIAPFANDLHSPRVAERLSQRISEREPERLLAPGAFVADPGISPSPAAVRRWAYNAAVDTLVVGEVVAPTEFEEGRVEVVLRSGHSGAEEARLSESFDRERDLDAAVGRLAVEMFEALGWSPAESPAAVKPRTDGIAAVEEEAEAGRGLDAGLIGEGFDDGAPIEIKADEAEIVNRAQGRELLFEHNVLVKQANVTLRSDRLEASYKRGESEPERLVAQGRVSVDQGDRRAKCDRAIYLRSARRLTCSGHAELVQGCDVVRGESIRFDLADDRARVEGAASIVIRPEADGGGCVDMKEVL